jgi:hypothetical protein
MKKNYFNNSKIIPGGKKFLIVLASIFAIGIVLGAIGVLAGGLDIKTPKPENYSYTEQNLSKINIAANLSNVYIAVTDSNEFKIYCNSVSPEHYSYSCENGEVTLKYKPIYKFPEINIGSYKLGYDGFGYFPKAKIIVEVPFTAELELLNIEVSVGNISINQINAKNFNIYSGFGNTSFYQSTGQNCTAYADVGNLNLSECYFYTACLENDVGDIDFSGGFENDAKFKSDVGNTVIQLKDFKNISSGDYRIIGNVDVGNFMVNGIKYFKDYGAGSSGGKILIICEVDVGDLIVKLN